MAARARVIQQVLTGNFLRNSAPWKVANCRSTRRLWVVEQSRSFEEFPRAAAGLLSLSAFPSGGRLYSTLAERTGDDAGILEAYQRLSQEGLLKAGDPAQERVVSALDKLAQDLTQQQPRHTTLQGLFGRFFGKHETDLQGLYIYGGVGRGKTMLMDLFYEKVHIRKKNRIHFHAFMLDVHDRLHKLSNQLSGKTESDLIKVVANQLIKESHLLCLDEVEVTDVADALIMRRLFQVLWPLGMVVVCTSNTRPDKLYRGGLNRPLFEPFIYQLKEQCKVYSLDNEEGQQSRDYRRGLSKLDQLYLHPLVDHNDELLSAFFKDLTEGHEGEYTEVPVMMGRKLRIVAAKEVARGTFVDLCGGPYGAADYMAIVKNFEALFLERIPWLGDADLENQARRFITLIDVMYESNVLFVCSAAVPVEELFTEKTDLSTEAVEELQQVQEELRLQVVGEGGSSGRSTAMVGDMEWSGTGRPGASLAKLSGNSPSFTRAASARTVSRLLEMQSPAYLSRAGRLGGVMLSKLEESGE